MRRGYNAGIHTWKLPFRIRRQPPTTPPGDRPAMTAVGDNEYFNAKTESRQSVVNFIINQHAIVQQPSFIEPFRLIAVNVRNPSAMASHCKHQYVTSTHSCGLSCEQLQKSRARCLPCQEYNYLEQIRSGDSSHVPS